MLVREIQVQLKGNCCAIAKTWKQSKCPSTVEWIKIWYIEWMKICDNLEGWGRGGERWEGGLGRRGHRCTYG